MNVEEIKNFTLSLGGAKYDYPFENDFETFVLRHAASKKWFGIYLSALAKSLLKDCGEQKKQKLEELLGGRGRVFVLNLKCEPALSYILQQNFIGVLPAYHMNKKHWICVLTESDADDVQIKQLISLSYDITAEKADKI